MPPPLSRTSATSQLKDVLKVSVKDALKDVLKVNVKIALHVFVKDALAQQGLKDALKVSEKEL